MADIVVDKLVNEIVFKFSEGSKSALDKVNQTFQNLEKSVQNISKNFASFSGNLKKVSTSIEGAGKRASSVSKTYGKMGQGLKDINKTASETPQKIDKTSKSFENLNKVGKEGTHNIKDLSAGYSKFVGVLGAVGQAWRSIRNHVVGATAAVGGIVYGVDRRLATIDNDSRIAQTEGIDYETQQRLAYGFQKGGSSSSEAKSTIAKLIADSASINPGEYNRGLAIAGVNPSNKDGTKKNVAQIVYDLADSLHIMKQRLGGDDVHFQEIRSKLHLSAKDLENLSQGSGKFKSYGDELVDRGGLIPNNTGKIAQAFREGKLLPLKAQVSALAAEFSRDLAPAIGHVIDGMSKWLKVNHKWLSQNMADYVTGIGKGFGDVGKDLKGIVDSMGLFSDKAGTMETSLDRINKSAKITRDLLIAIGAALVVIAPIPTLVGGATFAGIAYYDKFSESEEGFKPVNSAVTQNKMIKQPLKALEMGYLLGGGVPPTSTTNNVTIHVNGSSHPDTVANTIQDKLNNVPKTSVAATLSPGYNRPRHT